MPKKVNIKKFLSDITENQILESLFSLNKITNTPEVNENMDKKERSKILYEFYKNLDPENRLDIEDTINLISPLSNKYSFAIIKSFIKSNKIKETPLIVLSKTYTDLAIALYIENFEKVEELKSISNFYLKSGYKRYETNDKPFKDIITNNDKLSEKFTELLSENENTTHVEVSTYEYDDKYFTTIKYDKNTKELLLIFIPKLGELLLKASGNFEKLFSYAENYLRIMNGFSINPKNLDYNLSSFLNMKDKTGEITEASINSPLMPHKDVRTWQLLNITLERSATKQKINFTFPSSKEATGKVQLADSMEIFQSENIKLYDVTKLRLKADVNDSTVKKGHSICSVTLEKNKSNLNLLKPEHVMLNQVLLDNKICLGWKEIQF
ncbi:MAG: hypothetical protein QG614_117 [Patescibacteria group bacterium]|nr:hypothetical protein [Patescibacteria group bacterium]